MLTKADASGCAVKEVVTGTLRAVAVAALSYRASPVGDDYSATCQPRASARSASAPITGASARAYSIVT